MANEYKLKTKTFSVARESESISGVCSSPCAAYEVLRGIFAVLDDDQEHFVVLALNGKGRVVGYKVVSSGTETACLVSPSQVYRAALVLGGTSVICCHNHPSGDTSPSREDEMLTRRLRSAGECLGLPLSDHIILARECQMSFRAREGWNS